MTVKQTFDLRLLRVALGVFLALLSMGLLTGSVETQAQAALSTTQAQSVPNETPTSYSTLVLRVYFRDVAERDRLATELAAEEAPTTGGYLTVVGDQARMAALRARGLRVEIDQAQTAAYNTPPLFGHNPDTFYGGYYTVEEVQDFMSQKAEAYPTLVEKVDIGDSWCKTHLGACTQPDSWAGYELFAMHITNRAIPGPKPVFWFNGGLHSREIATTEVAIRYISYLLDNYESNADARWLVDHHDIWIMPMVNPDGRHMVENGSNQPRSQRKNADRDDGCTTWPPPGIGTDLNRNFPFLWNCCGGSSGAPCSDVYRGPSAGSEEETQAVVNKIRELIPDQRGPGNNDPAPITATGNYVDMHAYGRTNLYLWGWTNAQTPNHVDLRNIAAHMTAPDAGGNNYQYCQAAPCYYVTDGASDDWEYGELGAPAYTVEIGTTFFPQYTCVDNPCGSSPGLWPENRGMLLYMAKIARTPYLLTRGPDANNAVTNPMTVTQGSASQLSATINYAWTGNAYLQNVAAAEYYIDTPPWMPGAAAMPMSATDGNFNSPTEAVQAAIDTSTLPAGRHLMFVRGRGVNDYAGFQSWGPMTATWLTVLPAQGTPTATPTACTGPITRTGAINTGSPQQLGQIARNGIVSTCAAPKTCPGVCCNTTPYHYNSFTFTNTNATTACITVNVNALTCTGTQSIFSAAYLGSFEYLSPCTNYLADIGSSPNNTGSYSFNVPAGATFVVVVHENNHMTGCPFYSIAVSGLDGCTITPTVTVPPATSTSTRTSTVTATRIGTSVAPSVTAISTITSTTQPATATATRTPIPTATPCTIMFSDVPVNHTFYPFIRCLACRGIVSGYADGTFKPGNEITRGQIAKMVSNAAGFSEDPGLQIYEDVNASNTFYVWINRLSRRGHMGGYACGTVPEEPCVLPQNRPYFRPCSNATRGQLAKIVSNAAGIQTTPSGVFYTDVQEDNPFYVWIMRLTERGVMSGYECGGVGEPCDPQNRPYFRPFNNVTRGQASKIVANTFFPGCEETIR